MNPGESWLGPDHAPITQLQVTFSEPVNLSAGAFTLGLVNNYGSGANDGSGNSFTY